MLYFFPINSFKFSVTRNRANDTGQRLRREQEKQIAKQTLSPPSI